MLLAFLLRHLVTKGTLRVIGARGTVHSFQGDIEGPTITVKLHDAKT